MKTDVRLLVALLGFITLLKAEPDPLTLWYDRPAVYWEEALPVGNGRIGAMVFGGATRDHIQLNEETIWSGAPVPAESDPAFQVIRRRRQELLFQGQFRASEDFKLAPADLAALSLPAREPIPGTTTARHVAQPLGDLFLHFEHGTAREQNYRRSLDLDTAIATTTYVAGGVSYSREVFASHPARVLAVQLKADQPGALSFTAVMDYRRDVQEDMYRYDAELGPKVASVTTPPRPRWSALGGNRFVWQGRGHPEGTRFEARFLVQHHGGKVTGTADGFRVSGADEVTILMAVGTDFRGGDPAALAGRDLDAVAAQPFEALRAAHVADHQALFRRVAIDLGRTRAATLPTHRRIMAQMWGVQDNRVDPRADRDPDLYALYFQYGRYLMIASSRPGTLPPPLQGLWNDSLLPPWFGQHTSDINVEMNYWPAETTNLAECHTALFDLVDTFQPAARATARLSYGARGQVLHAMTNYGPKTTTGDWPDFSGWLVQHYWEHFAFGGDRVFLRDRAYPLLKDCALFYLDTTVRDPASGRWMTGPTYSPENRFLAPDDGRPAHVDVGVTLSMAVAREVFTHFVRASTILETDAELRAQVQERLGAMAPYAIGRDGRLQEWRSDYGETEPGHRHLSHLYPLFPGAEFTPRGTPELAEAARRALLRRLDHNSGWTGWSRAWVIALAARLGDAKLAHEQLRLQLERTTWPNLMDSHPRLGGNTACFQIDGNFGTTAAIAEMLVQSHAGEIELLPALPAAWPRGSFSGLRARGGFTVSARWSGGRLDAATLRAQGVAPAAVRAPVAFTVVSAGREIARSQADRGSQVARFSAQAGADYELKPIP
ncbi:MAG: glycoside hydrolase family 95 protein [Opitutaceae bacterium]